MRQFWLNKSADVKAAVMRIAIGYFFLYVSVVASLFAGSEARSQQGLLAMLLAPLQPGAKQ
jgi:hypothetical protein